MTTQGKDSFYYKGEHFNVFDISDNKLLSCKNCVGEAFGVSSTGLYRDSVAEYEIVDGLLTLKETAAHVFDNLPVIAERDFYKNRKPPKCAPGTIIPFSGYLIVYQGGFAMDFFSRIFNADKAFELEFDEGIFVNSTDLARFIQTGKDYIRQISKTENECDDPDFFHDVAHMMDVMKDISSVVPAGNYSSSTYVWRFERSECVLCESKDDSTV